jgi:hypothetical protein
MYVENFSTGIYHVSSYYYLQEQKGRRVSFLLDRKKMEMGNLISSTLITLFLQWYDHCYRIAVSIYIKLHILWSTDYFNARKGNTFLITILAPDVMHLSFLALFLCPLVTLTPS